MLASLDERRFAFELARRGITAQQLAERAGMTEQALSRVRHHPTITARMLLRLAVAIESFPVLPGVDMLLAQPTDPRERGRAEGPLT